MTTSQPPMWTWSPTRSPVGGTSSGTRPAGIRIPSPLTRKRADCPGYGPRWMAATAAAQGRYPKATRRGGPQYALGEASAPRLTQRVSVS